MVCLVNRLRPQIYFILSLRRLGYQFACGGMVPFSDKQPYRRA
jgi:hypothetical protein